MKKLRFFIFLVIMLTWYSCTKEQIVPKSDKQRFIGVWSVKKVTKDIVDLSDQYSKTKIRFEQNDYVIDDRPSLSPLMRTGEVKLDTAKHQLILNHSLDLEIMNYKFYGDKELELQFMFYGSGYKGDRVNQISGFWYLVLIK